MYRHGFLVAPALVAAAVNLLHGVAVPDSTRPVLEPA